MFIICVCLYVLQKSGVPVCFLSQRAKTKTFFFLWMQTDGQPLPPEIFSDFLYNNKKKSIWRVGSLVSGMKNDGLKKKRVRGNLLIANDQQPVLR